MGRKMGVKFKKEGMYVHLWVIHVDFGRNQHNIVKQWQLTPVFLPKKFHGQRSLVGCSPWGHKELEMTE